MGTEIERKFLVLPGADWKGDHPGRYCCQGYICSGPAGAVRVRIMDDEAWLTLKGNTQGIARAEYEYPIPVEDARAMLKDLVRGGLVEKIRYRVPFQGLIWEVDEFLGENAGLTLAEVELEDEEQPFAKPQWAGRDVSDDTRYLNACLAKKPYSHWKGAKEE